MRDFAEILSEVRVRIQAACARVARSPDEVEIIAISKTHGPDVVREAWDCGLRVFGENKVQEAAWKIPECPSGTSWHLVGHLQRNKVRAAVEYFSVIHSVDSLRLLDALEAAAEEAGVRPEVLLEVNVSGESSKFGLKPEAVPEVVERALTSQRVTLTGLMTMAPFALEAEDSRPYFRALRELRDELQDLYSIDLPRLSMGMSGDFEVAVEEGATWLRLGTILFGERPKYQRPQSAEADVV